VDLAWTGRIVRRLSYALGRMPNPPASDSLTRRGLKVIGVSLRGAPKQFTFGISLAVLFAGATVASSVVIGRIVDDVLQPGLDQGLDVRRGLWIGVAALVGVGALKGVGVFGRRYGAYSAQFHLQAMYRRKVTRRYLELPIAWHRRHPTGELLSNANADIEAAFFLAAPLPMSVAAFALLLITAALLIVSDPLLAGIGFVVGPVLGFVNSYFARRMRESATLAQQARADLSSMAHESFDAAIVVKTMGREEAESARFGERSQQLRDRMIDFATIRAKFDPLMEGLPNLGILAVLLVGAARVEAGAITPGELVQFAYLFRLVAIPIRVFGWLLGELPRAIVGYERVERVLLAEGKTVYGATTPTGSGGVEVAVDGVTYRHPVGEGELAGNADDELAAALGLAGRRANGASAAPAPAPGDERLGDERPGDADDESRGVQDVHFHVEAGRTIAVVGATGSGKSTVTSLLVRLLDPDAGVVALGGYDLRDLDRDALADTTSIVFQEAFVFDDTVAGNITLGLDVPHDAVVEAARLAGADAFIQALPDGYDTRVGERGATLSGGQRQRIALARALVRKPRLLVLDDATSAVDPAVEAEILANLRSAELPSTVVIVAYRNGSISLADEVVFVEKGTVAARGTHVSLRATVPAYDHLVSAYDKDRA
jgi:ATP-binding cassette subfamily B protein